MASSELPAVEIPGEHLRLVPASTADAEAVVGGRAPAAVRCAAGFPQEGTVDGLRMALSQGRQPGWWVVVDGLAVGDCGVHSLVDDDGEVEIGYGLAAPVRGRGLGRELVAVFSSWLLAQPVVRAVVAHAAPDNQASRRALLAAGFTETGSDDGGVAYRLSRLQP